MWARTFRRSSGETAIDVLAVPADGLSDDVLLVAVGPFASMAKIGRRAAAQPGHRRDGRSTRAGCCRCPTAIGELAKAHKLVVTLEDNGVRGGVGSAVSAALRRAEIDVPCRDVGLPQEFQAHASRGEVLADVGITDQNIARQVTGWVAALGSAVSEHEVSRQLD